MWQIYAGRLKTVKQCWHALRTPTWTQNPTLDLDLDSREFFQFSMFCKTRWCIPFLSKTQAKQAKTYTPPDFYGTMVVYTFFPKSLSKTKENVDTIGLFEKVRNCTSSWVFLPCACLCPHGPGSLCMTSCPRSKKSNFPAPSAIWHPSKMGSFFVKNSHAPKKTGALVYSYRPPRKGPEIRKNHDIQGRWDIRKNCGYPEILGNMIFGKNRTSENVGSTEQVRKFESLMASGEKQDI